MDEYIDRDVALDIVKRTSGDYATAWCEISKLPAADVAPVKYGEWKVKPCIKSVKHVNIPVVECSVCGLDFCDIINNHNFIYRYCPSCGAEMDLERIEELYETI